MTDVNSPSAARDTSLSELGVLKSRVPASRIRTLSKLGTSQVPSAAKRPLGKRTSDVENKAPPVRQRTQSTTGSMLPAPARLRTMSTAASSLSARPPTTASSSMRLKGSSVLPVSEHQSPPARTTSNLRRVQSSLQTRATIIEGNEGEDSGKTALGLPSARPVSRQKKASSSIPVGSVSGREPRLRNSKTPVTAQRVRDLPSAARASPSNRVPQRKRSTTPHRKPKMSSTLNDLLLATAMNSPTLDDLTRSADGPDASFDSSMLSPLRPVQPRPNIELENEKNAHIRTRTEFSTAQRELETMRKELEAAKRETSLISAMASSVENDLSLTRQELNVYQTNVNQTVVIRANLEALRWDDLSKACKREVGARKADRQMLGVLREGLQVFQAQLTA